MRAEQLFVPFQLRDFKYKLYIGGITLQLFKELSGLSLVMIVLLGACQRPGPIKT